MKFKVISLDVWGHAPDDCSKYDCPGGDRCEGFTVNAAYYTGRTIEVPDDVAIGQPFVDALINSLIEAGELNELARGKGAVQIDGESDFTLFLNDGKDGRPILHLENAEDRFE